MFALAVRRQSNERILNIEKERGNGKVKNKIIGIIICLIIAIIATILGGLKIGSLNLEIVGAPVFAILMGMIITLVTPKLAKSEHTKDGIKFTSKKILQWAVIVLGFTLNLGNIAKVGAQSLPVIVSTIATSLIVAYVLFRCLRMDSKVATLIGVGSSICGGSAIAATAPVIDADDEEIAQAISVVFLFNVLAALIFPTLGHGIGMGSEGFAIFAGTAVNDTSSVTAAASTAEKLYNSNAILSTAVIVKLTRTLAIIPITLALAIYRTKKEQSKAASDNSTESKFSIKKIFPWFILYFVAASIITTIVGTIPSGDFKEFYLDHFVKSMKWLAKFFIAMAMAAIGLNTNIKELIKKGGKPIILGFCCWVMISLVSIGVQMLTGIYSTNLK